MKKIFFSIALMSVSFIGYSQPCTANAPTGTAGLSPAPASVPCIQRGVAYDQVIQVENFSTFVTPIGTATVDFARIDSITNLPCGITWDASKLTYAAGETGCIRVHGTSTETVGQYRLKMYMTFQADVPIIGNNQQFSGELHDLRNQAAGFSVTIPVDIDYVSRVIETGNPCPAPDTNSTLTSSGVACLAVGISKNEMNDFSMSLYPNPNTGAFEIDLTTKEQDGNYLLRIFDAQGKTVYSENLNVNGSKLHQSLLLDGLNSGIYTVNLNSNSTSDIQKMVIY